VCAGGVEGESLTAVLVDGVGAGEPLVGAPVVGWPPPLPSPVLGGEVGAVDVGGCVVGGDVGSEVVGGGVVGLDGAPPPEPPPEPGEVGPVVPTGTPPCSVTTIPPGLNTIRAVHRPLGAAEVAVAVTSRLCPGASVPELWLSTSQGTEGDADQDSGPVPVSRKRICTLSGSAERWLTLT
jgi:hypothetical protein